MRRGRRVWAKGDLGGCVYIYVTIPNSKPLIGKPFTTIHHHTYCSTNSRIGRVRRSSSESQSSSLSSSAAGRRP